MHLWLTPATIYWGIFMCVLISPAPLLHLFICNAQVSDSISLSSAVTLSADLPQSFMWCLFLLLSFISSSSNLFFFKCYGSFAVDLFHPISHSLVCLPAHRRLSFHKTLSSSPGFLYWSSPFILSILRLKFKIWIEKTDWIYNWSDRCFRITEMQKIIGDSTISKHS